MAYWDARYSDRPNIIIRFHVNQGAQNYAANTTQVNMAVEIIEAVSQPSWNLDAAQNWWSMTVAGQTRNGNFTFDFRSSGLQSWYLWTGSITVTHDANGYATVSVGGASHAGVLGDANIGAQSFTLTRIPKVPVAPTMNSVVDLAANSFGVRYTRGNNMGATIIEDETQWSANNTFTNTVWTDKTSTGYSNPRGLGTGPGPELSPNTPYWVRTRSRNSRGWSAWSNTISGTTLGHPNQPTGLSATPSSSVSGRITLTWTAPTTPGVGGIVGYNIFRDGTQIATTTGTATTFTDNGRTPYTQYSYKVAARNNYSDQVGGYSLQSLAAFATATGAPSAPLNLVAVSNPSVPGRVDLSWDAPANVGTGITGYYVRRSEGTLVATINGTGRTYSVTGLTPGNTYTFYVTARNALSDTEGSQSAPSNSVSSSPVGEPPAPTAVTATASSTVAGRLTVQWTADSTGLSGFNIFQRTGSGDVLLQQVGPSVRSFPVDNLTPGASYSYVVRGRTVYTNSLPTNGYPGNWGGPASNVATGTPGSNTSQAVPTLAVVTSSTNTIFAGSYVINAVSLTTIGYQRSGPNIAQTVSGGDIINTTNATFNGTFVLTATTPTSISFAKTAANVPLLPASGYTYNNTNASLNGTFTVTSVNVGANLLSYSKTGSNITSTAVPVNALPGQSTEIVNQSNAVFNGTGKVILSTTATTLTYAQTASNVAESNAAGTVTNTTNRDTFNGTFTITAIPDFNVVKYAKTATAVPLRTWQELNGVVYRTVSPATLNLHFRSGWAG